MVQTIYIEPNTGNLGIGTATPLRPLHIQGDSIITGNVGIGTTNISGGQLIISRPNGGTSLRLKSVNGNYVEQYFEANGVESNFEFGGPFSATQNNSFAYVNRTSGSASEAGSFFILSNGNVGIGTKTPTGILGLGINGASFPLPSGNAPLYGVRAWVNFRYSAGVVIQGSGNVSSITRTNTGDYTINLTTALPTANYAVTFGAATGNGRFTYLYNGTYNTTADSTRTTSSFRILYADNAIPTPADPAVLTIMVIC